MKTLDPASVVREGEFAIAASTAGYAGNVQKLLENLSDPNDKTWLVPENREAFRKLAIAYVQNKAKSYDRLYDDMERTFDYYGIDKELLPTRASSTIEDVIGTKEKPTETPPGFGKEQYDELVKSLGKERADAYLASRGITFK